MPLNKLMVLLLIVIAAAGGTIWLATALWGQEALAENWLVVVSVMLVVYLAVRFISLRGGR